MAYCDSSPGRHDIIPEPPRYIRLGDGSFILDDTAAEDEGSLYPTKQTPLGAENTQRSLETQAAGQAGSLDDFQRRTGLGSYGNPPPQSATSNSYQQYQSPPPPPPQPQQQFPQHHFQPSFQPNLYAQQQYAAPQSQQAQPYPPQPHQQQQNYPNYGQPQVPPPPVIYQPASYPPSQPPPQTQYPPQTPHIPFQGHVDPNNPLYHNAWQ